jgi:hypothetical protein
MKKVIALLLLANFACQNNNKLEKENSIKIEKDSAITNKIAIKKEIIAESIIDSVENRIYSLKKVQKLNTTSKVSILTQEPPDSDAHYTFKVGFNREDRFETVFNFSFDKSQSIIFYYDVVNDELIDIDKWDGQ